MRGTTGFSQNLCHVIPELGPPPFCRGAPRLRVIRGRLAKLKQLVGPVNQSEGIEASTKVMALEGSQAAIGGATLIGTNLNGLRVSPGTLPVIVRLDRAIQ